MSKNALDSLLNEVNTNQLLLDKSVEWLYDLPEDARYNFIENLCASDNKNVFLFLQKFLTTDDSKMAIIILKKLSMLNQSEAYNTIKNALPYMSNKEVFDLAERTLRKLSLKGVSPDNKKQKTSKLPPIYKVLLSNIDGAGSRSLIISRINKSKLKSMFILINERIGIKDSFGNDFTKKEFEKMIDFQDSEGIVLRDISYEKAVLLIKDAIKINYETKTLIPPTFHFIKDSIFEEKIFDPQEYIPIFIGLDLNKIAKDTSLISKTNKIFENQEFFSWFLYDDEIKKFCTKKAKNKLNDKIIKEFIDKFIITEIKYFKRRLILAADFIYSTSNTAKDKKLVKLLLCSALNIETNKELPFLKELAIVSLNNADISSLMGSFLQLSGGDSDL